MAFVKTDDAHYKGIAAAIRAMHGGADTYTPAEMAAYLEAGSAAVKPWNIAKGVTIMGVEGTLEAPATPTEMG